MSTIDRRPAEVWPPGFFVQEELGARGWTTADLARRMGNDPTRWETWKLAVDLLIAEPDLILDQKMADRLARAFGISAQFFLNMEATWRKGSPR